MRLKHLDIGRRNPSLPPVPRIPFGAITLDEWKTVSLTPACGLPDLRFGLLRPR
jgi:hypothetical protein